MNAKDLEGLPLSRLREVVESLSQHWLADAALVSDVTRELDRRIASKQSKEDLQVLQRLKALLEAAPPRRLRDDDDFPRGGGGGLCCMCSVDGEDDPA